MGTPTNSDLQKQPISQEAYLVMPGTSFRLIAWERIRGWIKSSQILCCYEEGLRSFWGKPPLSDIKGVVATTSLTRWGQPRPPFPRPIWYHWTHPKSALRKSTIISFNLHFYRALTLPINSFIHPHTAVRNWGTRMSRGMIIGHSFVAGLAGHFAGQHEYSTWCWPLFLRHHWNPI